MQTSSHRTDQRVASADGASHGGGTGEAASPGFTQHHPASPSVTQNRPASLMGEAPVRLRPQHRPAAPRIAQRRPRGRHRRGCVPSIAHRGGRAPRPAALPAGCPGEARSEPRLQRGRTGTHLTRPEPVGKRTAAKPPRPARQDSRRPEDRRMGPTSPRSSERCEPYPGAGRTRAARRTPSLRPRPLAAPSAANQEPKRPERRPRGPVDVSQGSALRRKADSPQTGFRVFLVSSISVSGEGLESEVGVWSLRVAFPMA